MDSKTFIHNFKQRSNDLAKFIEVEFVKLNYKVAKCSYDCFDKNLFSEAILCEKECQSSVQTAFASMKEMERVMKSQLNDCRKNVEDAIEGKNDNLLEASAGYGQCYEKYYDDLILMKQEMEKEFSFYH